MCEISIIVPVYNVEKYLHKCVDSILAQTFADFELILVDDGSPDGSGCICDEYVEKDNRVKVIHKKNGGLSDARNAGLDIAQGNYIGFVDSDDYVANDMYEVLYTNIIREQADLSICGIYDVYEGKNLIEKDNKYLVLNQDELLKLIFEGNLISVHAVNKLYAREIFQELRYPKERYHEDSYVIIDIISSCTKIVVDTRQKYYYFHREGSINTEIYSNKQLDYIDAWEKNEIKVKDRNIELKKACHQRVCFANFLVLDKIINSNMQKDAPETKKIVSYLRNNFFFIIRNRIFTKSRKFAMCLLMVSLNLYVIPSMFKNKILLKANI